jgi:5-formyltetrahydrofolate cyclo-ligase
VDSIVRLVSAIGPIEAGAGPRRSYDAARMRSKGDVRSDVWRAMDREGVARFPGARGRIPNFAGAKQAAERLAGHPAWTSAATLKVNPDSPQTHARRMALAEGKLLVMAVPRLRDEHPFRLLDPRRLSEEERRQAATIKGAIHHGEATSLDEVPKLDLVLAGSVAVNRKGARVGKGGGYSDLEYALLRERGKISRGTVVATTVHPMQVVRGDLPMTAHDIPVDLVATPRAVIAVDGTYERPQGILWDHVQPAQISEIPVLERLGSAR